MHTTRRDMIKSLAALPRVRFPGAEPDLILSYSSVYTLQPGNPRVSAIAMRGGRFLSVGTDREILPKFLMVNGLRCR